MASKIKSNSPTESAVSCSVAKKGIARFSSCRNQRDVSVIDISEKSYTKNNQVLKVVMQCAQMRLIVDFQKL